MALMLHKQVRDNDTLRRGFDALAGKTFGLSFADWHAQGWWSDAYIPYVLADGDTVAANAAVNRLTFRFPEGDKHFIQIGTVMTDPAYRNRGLSRRLLEEILRDWRDRCDALYLYANDTVLDFYPRFGFRREQEYAHCLPLAGGRAAGRRLHMDSAADRQLLRQCFARANPFAQAALADNFGLVMFYASSFMQDGFYWLEEAQAVVAADFEGPQMTCYDIFGGEGSALADILAAAAHADTRAVTLGFTPRETAGMSVQPLQGEDTLFVLDGKENPWARAPLRLPLLSHA